MERKLNRKLLPTRGGRSLVFQGLLLKNVGLFIKPRSAQTIQRGVTKLVGNNAAKSGVSNSNLGTSY